MMKKHRNLVRSFLFFAVLVVMANDCCCAEIDCAVSLPDYNEFSISVQEDTHVEIPEMSMWDSCPIEVHDVNIQVLDKISGKVFKKKIFVNAIENLGSIELCLRRCFKNSPEDSKEIHAFIEIRENKKLIFSRWLFASSVSVNLFSHPIYDVRIEF